jgi:uncharacterized membrane protein
MHKSSKWLIGEICIIILVVVVLKILGYSRIFPYQWYKLLHILGAILLLGNIIVTAVWMLMAERTNDRPVLRFATTAVNWADVFFTVPGIFLLFTNGDILAAQWGGVFRTGWLTVSLILFMISGVIWLGYLLRYQHHLIRLSLSTQDDKLSADFFAVLHKWYVGGALATVLPLVSLVLMFLKPTIW